MGRRFLRRPRASPGTLRTRRAAGWHFLHPDMPFRCESPDADTAAENCSDHFFQLLLEFASRREASVDCNHAGPVGEINRQLSDRKIIFAPSEPRHQEVNWEKFRVCIILHNAEYMTDSMSPEPEDFEGSLLFALQCKFQRLYTLQPGCPGDFLQGNIPCPRRGLVEPSLRHRTGRTGRTGLLLPGLHALHLGDDYITRESRKDLIAQVVKPHIRAPSRIRYKYRIFSSHPPYYAQFGGCTEIFSEICVISQSGRRAVIYPNTATLFSQLPDAKPPPVKPAVSWGLPSELFQGIGVSCFHFNCSRL